MNGNYRPIINIRRKVFTEIARLAYEELDPVTHLEESIFTIIPGEVAQFRESVFKERAIVGERMRMGLGLPMRKASEHDRLSKGIEKIDTNERVVMHPLVEVIPFACEACPTKGFLVTNNCRKCLAHPCVQVCPVNAVSIGKYQAEINQEKCIRCGRCREACPYSAIVGFDRPCASVCGVKAIGSDYLGRALIDQEKCVACGMCLVKCPFGAIADKTEIYQLVKAMKKGAKIYAAIAPAFVGQFGPLVTPDILFEAIRQLGMEDVVEVSLGADVETISEAKEFLEKVPEERPFLGTSCCPAWAFAARKNYPELASCISDSATPMMATARRIKREHPDAAVVFIGPCIAKKNEASQVQVRSLIDFVITFEELMGMFAAKGLELPEVEGRSRQDQASATGRNFAVTGGVAAAVTKAVQELDPSRDVPAECANGLEECMKLLKLAQLGKKDGYLLEGMGCPSGCIGGPGTLLPVNKAAKQVEEFAKQSPYASALQNVLALETKR